MSREHVGLGACHAILLEVGSHQIGWHIQKTWCFSAANMWLESYLTYPSSMHPPVRFFICFFDGSSQNEEATAERLLRSRRMIGFKTILVDNTRVPITLPKKFARIFHHPTFFHPAAHGKNREKPYIVTFQQAKQATWKKMSHKHVINQPTRTSSCHFPWLFPMIHFPSPYNSHPAISEAAGSCWTSSTNASLSWRNKWPWRGWCRSSTIAPCLGNWESPWEDFLGAKHLALLGARAKNDVGIRALGPTTRASLGHVGRFSIFDSCFYFRVLMIWSEILIGWDGFVLNGADYGADDIGLGSWNGLIHCDGWVWVNHF